MLLKEPIVHSEYLHGVIYPQPCHDVYVNGAENEMLLLLRVNYEKTVSRG